MTISSLVRLLSRPTAAALAVPAMPAGTKALAGGQAPTRVVHSRIIIGTRAWPLGNVVHGHQRFTEPQKRDEEHRQSQAGLPGGMPPSAGPPSYRRNAHLLGGRSAADQLDQPENHQQRDARSR
jgi:hypothetical protein